MARIYVHLETKERALIEAQLQLGMRPAAIAAGLMRARSTVIREIRRNGWHSPPELVRRDTRIAGGYRCVAADRRARVLRRKPRVVRKLVTDIPEYHPDTCNDVYISVVSGEGLELAQVLVDKAYLAEMVERLLREPDPNAPPRPTSYREREKAMENAYRLIERDTSIQSKRTVCPY
jgi:IS30 family transposase